MTTGEPVPAGDGDDNDDTPRWEVVASRPDYSQRGPEGRFASLETAERRAEELRSQGYRDVQVEPLPDDVTPLT